MAHSPVKMCQRLAILPSTGNHLLLALHWSSQGNSSVADRKTWPLLATSSAMLPATTNHFDGAGLTAARAQCGFHSFSDKEHYYSPRMEC